MVLLETAYALARTTVVEELRCADDELSGALLRRNFDAFAAQIADDALFVLNGRAFRGKREITGHWAMYFITPHAPFCWEASRYAVLERRTLGAVAGLVSAFPSHRPIGAFEAIWRRGGNGAWRVVFMQGCLIRNFLKRTRRAFEEVRY
jgi:ketosteroid isomerase-like protein